MSLLWVLLWVHAVFADTTPSVDEVNRRFDRLTCDLALEPFAAEAPAQAGTEVAKLIVQGIPSDAAPSAIGPAFLKAYGRIVNGRPLADCPYYDGNIPHLSALQRLNKLVCTFAPALSSRADAAAVARTVGNIYAGLGAHASMQRRQIDELAYVALRDFGAPASAVRIRRALENLGHDLGEIPPSAVLKRLDEVGVRQFIATEVTLIRSLFNGPRGPRPRHLMISTAANLTVEALRARLRNDYRLLTRNNPDRHSKDAPEVRRALDFDGGEALRLRQAIDQLGDQLEADALAARGELPGGAGAIETRPSGLFHHFDFTTNELIMTDALASARLRNLLLDKRPMQTMQPLPPEPEVKFRLGRSRPEPRYAIPPENRVPRLAGLKWYIAYVRPELMINPFAQPGPVIDESQPWRLPLDERGLAIADAEIRRGGFDPEKYLAWSEAAESCVRLPKIPVQMPPPPSLVQRAARAAAPHALAIGLSIVTSR